MCAQAGEGAVLEEIDCDAVAMSGGWSPVVHLWSHCGGKLIWDDDHAMFRPDPERAPTRRRRARVCDTAGVANGHLFTADDVCDGCAQARGKGCCTNSGCKRPMPVADAAEGPMIAGLDDAARGQHALRSKAWLDYQNDVKVSDVQSGRPRRV